MDERFNVKNCNDLREIGAILRIQQKKTQSNTKYELVNFFLNTTLEFS